MRRAAHGNDFEGKRAGGLEKGGLQRGTAPVIQKVFEIS